jgi:hypothetical protein
MKTADEGGLRAAVWVSHRGRGSVSSDASDAPTGSSALAAP